MRLASVILQVFFPHTQLNHFTQKEIAGKIVSKRFDTEDKNVLVGQQMLVLFIMMMTGWIACRKNIMTQEANKKVCSLIVNIANPAMILSSVLNREGTVSPQDLLITVPVALAVFAGLILLSLLIPLILKIPDGERPVYRVMTVFNNIGFMGLPIIAALYGNQALLYAAVFIFIYNLLIYTYGVYIFRGKKEGGGNDNPLKQIINPGVMACVIAFAVFLFGFGFPDWINTSVGMLSNLTAPLSMISIGVSFEMINWKAMFRDVRLLIFCVIKLLVIPVAGILLLKLVISNEVLLGVSMVVLATPIGSMTSMMAQEYGTGEVLAAQGVAVTTVLSIVTIPLISMLVL